MSTPWAGLRCNTPSSVAVANSALSTITCSRIVAFARSWFFLRGLRCFASQAMKSRTSLGSISARSSRLSQSKYGMIRRDKGIGVLSARVLAKPAARSALVVRDPAARVRTKRLLRRRPQLAAPSVRFPLCFLPAGLGLRGSASPSLPAPVTVAVGKPSTTPEDAWHVGPGHLGRHFCLPSVNRP